jgi:hypothetical protein
MPFGFKVPSFSDILGGIGDVGSAFGQGAARGRALDSQNTFNQDKLRALIDQMGLQTAAFNAGAPGRRASDAVRGDVLAGVQPAALSGGGRDLKVSGGLTPALLSQGTRNFGQLMNSAATGEGPADPSLLQNSSRQALLQQMMGSYGPYTQKFTQPTALPKAGFGEKLLQGLGAAAKIGGLFFGG